MEKMTFCEQCGNDVVYTEKEEILETKIKGNHYRCIGIKSLCKECNGEVYVGSIMNHNLNQLKKQIDNQKKKRECKDVQKKSLNKEDIEFLIGLQKEMLEQDTYGQASPRYWGIRQHTKTTATKDEYDGFVIRDVYDCSDIYDGDFEGIKKWLETLDGITDVETTYYEEIMFTYKDKECFFYSVDGLIDFLEEIELAEKIEIFYYVDDYEIVNGPIFLTIESCWQHLKANWYHYHKDAHPYAMSAWRNPEIDKLYKIIEETDWESMK